MKNQYDKAVQYDKDMKKFNKIIQKTLGVKPKISKTGLYDIKTGGLGPADPKVLKDLRKEWGKQDKEIAIVSDLYEQQRSKLKTTKAPKIKIKKKSKKPAAVVVEMGLNSVVLEDQKERLKALKRTNEITRHVYNMYEF